MGIAGTKAAQQHHRITDANTVTSEIIRLSSEGHSRRAIAAQLGVTEHTVRKTLAAVTEAQETVTEAARAPQREIEQDSLLSKIKTMIVRLGAEGRPVPEIMSLTGMPQAFVEAVLNDAEVVGSPAWERERAAQFQHLQAKAINDPAAVEVAQLRHQVEQLSQAIAQLTGEAPAQPGKRPVEQANERRVRACDTAENKAVLVIPDLHAPYHHQDAMAFLEAVSERYTPDHVICTGDELDFHAMSFHTSDPDLMAAGDELDEGRAFLRRLAEIFPEMDLCHSNHGSMAYRRGKEAGMPRHLILSYGDAIFGERDDDGSIVRPDGLGTGWRWHERVEIRVPNNRLPVIFVHGMAQDIRNNMRRMHCNVVQGHHHTTQDLRYDMTPTGQVWGMTLGCLIDDESYAYAYNKTNPLRPALGCGLIINGVPMLIPMLTDANGRWTGVLP